MLWSSPLAFAQFTYTNISGKGFVTGYLGPAGNVTIPTVIDGLPIVGIAEKAFQRNTNFVRLTLGDNISSIGVAAFFKCDALTDVFLGKGLSSIDGVPFQFCAGLTNIAVDPANPSFSSVDGILFDKARAKLIRFPEGRGGAYTIGGGVHAIEDYAFSYCLMTHAVVGSGVTRLGEGVFASCDYLIDVTLSKDVTQIGPAAFGYCYKLLGINVDPANPAYTSPGGVLYDKAQTKLIKFPGGLGGAYRVPKGVTSIEEQAFFFAPNITRLTIPASVTHLGFSALDLCKSMTEVYFAGNVPATEGFGFGLNPRSKVYYLAGSTGWGATFGNVPTALWNPQIHSAGFLAGKWGFDITGLINLSVVVEASDSLAPALWSPVSTHALGATGTARFSDPGTAGKPMRFYRLVFP